MRKYYVMAIMLAFFPYSFSQSKLKKPETKIAPVPPFTFLIEGNAMAVANTIRIEQMDLLVQIDFTEVKWKETLTLFDAIFTSFNALDFLKDEELKKKYAGMCIFGTDLFEDFKTIFSEVFQFKNENVDDTPINVCSVTPLSMTIESLKKGIANLSTLFNAINETWTAAEVKGSDIAQAVIFDYCSYFNDFSIVYESKASNILASLEELSDGHYPEVLFGNLVKNCTFSKNGEGEKYEVINCKGTKKGLRCQIQISQATNLRTYIQHHPVHYNDIVLIGDKKEDLFGRTTEVLELKYLDCDTEYSGDFMVCEEKRIPDHCKRGLDTDDVHTIIKYCNFTKSTPNIGTILPHGGILVQSEEKVDVMSGNTRISQQPPMVVYTPEVLTVRYRDEDYVFAPAILIDSLIIVESKLTDNDLQQLYGAVKWTEMMGTFDMELYFDIALLIVEILIIPFALVSFILAIRQQKDIKNLAKDIFGADRDKENFKRNRQQLIRITRK
jgi:hypothetical protein